MSGKKSITLLNGGALPVSQYYRYKKLRSAVRRAIDLSLSEGKAVTIYDSERGQTLAVTSRQGTSQMYSVQVLTPRIFKQLWEVK